MGRGRPGAGHVRRREEMEERLEHLFTMKMKHEQVVNVRAHVREKIHHVAEQVHVLKGEETVVGDVVVDLPFRKAYYNVSTVYKLCKKIPVISRSSSSYCVVLLDTSSW